MTHRAIRRLSAVLFLVLFAGVFAVALRNRETPTAVRPPAIPAPSPDPVASEAPPAPDLEIVRPVPRVTPRPAPSPRIARDEPRKIETPPSKSVDEAFAVSAALENLHESMKEWPVVANAATPQRMLGITPETLSAEEARDLGLGASQGAIRVQSVTPDSVAASIGLKAGDIITGLDGLPLTPGNEVGSLRTTMNQLTPGRISAMTIVRDGRPMTLYPTWDK